MVKALCWSIRIERNNTIFDNVDGSVESIWERVKFWVALLGF